MLSEDGKGWFYSHIKNIHFFAIRLTSLMGTAGVKFTKEELLALNSELNKIAKPLK